MKTWRLIYTGSHSGFFNMATDEAIVMAIQKGKAPPTLRFYTWDPQCISIGYFQRNSGLYDVMNVEQKKIDIVRRITGGRAVLHGNDLSYSLISHTDNGIFTGSIRETYLVIADALILGLSRLGIRADPVRSRQGFESGRRKYQNSPLCFATTLGHEISVNGKKLIGSAQRRWPGVFLQHGSVLLSPSQERQNLSSVSLSEIIYNQRTGIGAPSGMGVKVIISSLVEGFQRSLGINMIEGTMSSYELGLSENLMADKYSQDHWNFRYR